MNAKEFYSQFIKPNDLVFDIGANIGERTDIFVELGARVVAVEAQSNSFQALRSHFLNNDRVICLQKVAATYLGDTKTIRWSSHADTWGMASISNEWIEKAQENLIDTGGVSAPNGWDVGEIVETITLDNLIFTFGNPNFIKIDVEGSEDEVIYGLSRQVKALSFEFHSWDLGKIDRVLDNLIGKYTFNFSLRESFEWMSDRWVSRNDLQKILEQFRYGKEEYGDIYAKDATV